jgi:hypothetical protein
MSEPNRCRHLRTKSMFIPALADKAEADENSTGQPHHCWCNRSLTETGPDGKPVSNERCRSARACFEE